MNHYNLEPPTPTWHHRVVFVIAWILIAIFIFAVTCPALEIEDRFAVAANHGIPGGWNDALEIDGHNLIAQQLADAGVTWVRMRALRWDEVQPKKPTRRQRKRNTGYDWGKWHQVYEAYTSRGMKIIVPFLDTPAWATNGDHHTGAPKPKAWLRFMKAASMEFPEVTAWEVWNEPDIPQFFTGTPSEYATMHRTTWRVMKDRGFQVWGPAATAHSSFEKTGPVSEYAAMVLEGELKVDVFTYHDYGPTIETKISRAAIALERVAGRWPISITETNLTWRTEEYEEMTEEERADGLEELYLTLLYLGIDQVYWWGATDTLEGSPNGLLDRDYQPRATYWRLLELIDWASHPISHPLTP